MSVKPKLLGPRPRRTLSGKLLPPGTPRPAPWNDRVPAGPPVAEKFLPPRMEERYTPPKGGAGSRRERRDTLRRAGLWPPTPGTTEIVELPEEQDEKDVQYPLEARRRTREHRRKAKRQQRRGQRAYVREYLKSRDSDDVKAGQMRVLEAGEHAPGNYDRFHNVLNALRTEYGQEAPDEAVANL